METLLEFLAALDEMRVSDVLGHYRREAITAHVTAAATERWEVEFFDDGTVQIERFRGTDDGVASAGIEARLTELRTSR